MLKTNKYKQETNVHKTFNPHLILWSGDIIDYSTLMTVMSAIKYGSTALSAQFARNTYNYRCLPFQRLFLQTIVILWSQNTYFCLI